MLTAVIQEILCQFVSTKPLSWTYTEFLTAGHLGTSLVMMTSSNGNIFRVTGPLCGEFTGPGEFPTQRPVTRSFDVFFDLRLDKRLSKQPWGWWFETLLWSLWRHRNVEIWMKLHLASFKKRNSSMSSGWRRPFRFSLNIFNEANIIQLTHNYAPVRSIYCKYENNCNILVVLLCYDIVGCGAGVHWWQMAHLSYVNYWNNIPKLYHLTVAH